jgi:hypothetical protein
MSRLTACSVHHSSTNDVSTTPLRFKIVIPFGKLNRAPLGYEHSSKF